MVYNIRRGGTDFHLSEWPIMYLTVTLTFLIWSLGRFSQASPSDPYVSCAAGKACQAKFANGACDQECSSSACLRDGFDCLKDKGTCTAGYIQYCRDHYDNSHCEQGCNTAPCGWDGSDCYRNQYPIWAKGSFILHTKIPFQKGHFQNTSLLWAVSTVLQTSVRFRGMAPFQVTNDLLTMDTRQLADLYAQPPSYDSDGSVLFLQLDNRPCSRLPSTCFQYAIEAAHFLSAMMSQKHPLFPMIPEIQATVISVRGVDEEIGTREEVKLPKEERNASPSWMWPVVGVVTGLAVAVAVIIAAVFLWLKRRRHRREDGERVRHRSTATDGNNGGKAWTRRADQQEKRGRREKDSLKKKKKGNDLGKSRKEPLGEDSIRMRPLRKELDIGSDTDMTQSSMEDINKTICDHRSPDQKHFQVNHQQPRMLAPPRGWERNSIQPPPRPPRNTAPVQWCGPDGSVVLIRAVRSGLDRVVLELLRAGVPVNNTDHTGRSALHWACSVNHLPLTRTLVRYGAAVDLQDHKGETALFLSALHGCYDTARFLLLNGANQELSDCKGRRPLDVAREGLHHQVLELLLAHRVQRGPVPLDPNTEVLWDDRTYVYSPWVASPPCLPGRSASFSGVIGHRGMSTPPPDDWQMSRAECTSPQNWRPPPNQSATALVSPRILGRPSRPISTLQEVTSEDEERDITQEVLRAATPHFLSPQPAPRQRSFSCTQHALNRRSSANQPELSAATPSEKTANEHVEVVIVPQSKEASHQSENKTAGNVPSSAQTEPVRENSRNSNSKTQNERINNEPNISIQTTM
ncbi:neurogenic locus notch homolog protein 1 [Triplophysa rosa]|uniref:Neurogenic locus notch-like protein 1 n=1 Tax=Triplophysa rosa TaxID=992332 RepID=A0A9W7WQ31_TRIRA|nr:neurogenic locus notch homolog protein 1 [Triplophysa rosa]KAI7806267.1 putative neurogenic locus notch-like protein 1 [Triplophysa rosa]